MSWFGGAAGNLANSLDTIRSQVSNSLKDVFDEDQEAADPSAQILIYKDKLEALTGLIEEQKVEISKLKEHNAEILEQKQAVQLQKEDQCNTFR